MAGIMTFDRTDSRLGLLPLPPNSGLPEFGALSWPKSDKSDFGWERGGVRGQGLSIVLYPPHPNPLPKRGEGAHRDRCAIVDAHSETALASVTRRKSQARSSLLGIGRRHTAVVIHCSSFCFGAAPIWREAIWPFLKIINVGIDWMPYLAAVCGFSSTLSLTIFTLPLSVPAISSSAGAIMRQGPHHSAQKSTTTGPVAFNTSDSKVVSETLLTAMGRFLVGRQRRRVGGRTYERARPASRRLHREVTAASAASRLASEISMRSGTSVHTRAARMRLPG